MPPAPLARRSPLFPHGIDCSHLLAVLGFQVRTVRQGTEQEFSSPLIRYKWICDPSQMDLNNLPSGRCWKLKSCAHEPFSGSGDMPPMKTFVCLLALVAAFMVSPAVAEEQQDVPPVLDFTMKNIDGHDVDLAKYQGQVILIVNVASKCGLTPQYEQLQALHDKYADLGLAILAFPANEFLGQEPGTNSEIKEFCSTKYGVDFDMFSKVVVKGPGQCELYQLLTDKDENPIQWNFEKFLVNRDGEIIGRFSPRMKPDSPEIVAAIEKALGQ